VRIPKTSKSKRISRLSSLSLLLCVLSRLDGVKAVCTNGSITCIDGFYINAGACTACPAGSACTINLDCTFVNTACGAGTYSLDGEVTCNPCPAGKRNSNNFGRILAVLFGLTFCRIQLRHYFGHTSDVHASPKITWLVMHDMPSGKCLRLRIGHYLHRHSVLRINRPIVSLLFY
jgi:hypothetical protein